MDSNKGKRSEGWSYDREFYQYIQRKGKELVKERSERRDKRDTRERR